MALESGQSLSFYEILGPLGTGGMGEVYRARDTRLDREVAIKVLPEELAGDEERLRRFEREAKTLASLNHPHVAGIHGIDQVGDTCFIAMELVAGEDLGRRLARGRLPVREALDVCRQIAEGLEAAHEAGVVHRDLKPANVCITPERIAKVLDFGLAKPLRESGSHSSATAKPDSFLVTEEGMVLGTPTYMSPEQARARPVDRRTDIWAFGCVLYECLAGKRVFGGEAMADILGAIVGQEPEWTALPAETPARVGALLRRCLEKDPRQRLRDIGDARIELEDVLRHPEAEGSSPAVVSRRPGSRVAWGVAALALGLSIWLAFARAEPGSPATPGTVGRFAIDLRPGASIDVGDNLALDLSKDGRWLVFVGRQESAAAPAASNSGLGDTPQTRFFLREMGSFEAVPIPGTDGGLGPFFSPDGEWIAFFDYAAGKLKKVPRRGGAAIELCDCPWGSRGGDWGVADELVFTLGLSGGLCRVSAGGGEATPLIVPDWARGEKSYRQPHVLPGGKAVLATRSSASIRTYDDADIVLISLETGAVETLFQGGATPRYVASGHILYGRAGLLLAVPFDLERGRVSGAPFEVVDDLVTSEIFGTAQFAVSRAGTLVYLPGGPELYYSQLVWFEPGRGTLEKLALEPRHFNRMSFSPEGDRLAIEAGGGNDLILIHDLKRGTTSRLTTSGWDNNSPRWTPDGKRVVFDTNQSGTGDIYWQPADGSGRAELVLASDSDLSVSDVSPDGRSLVYDAADAANQVDVWILPLDEEGAAGEPWRFAGGPFNEMDARFAPDGKWVAYTADESDELEVYVRPFPEGGAKWQISTAGGAAPWWSADGKRLYYRSLEGWMAVDVQTEPEFRAAPPQLVHPDPDAKWYGLIQAPDGRRFVAFENVDPQDKSRFHVVVNLLRELQAER